ncbi:hypothetical protein M7I_7439 [Glarea lozoyensis 74030]|uniref:C2 domain-containing protein n=1 Tax=Glarea lozoyensis (strain ATCC 74030 / MF5533) TaxID=1104152 RepID=H0EXA6_GLAL7|nr:hypothetical protein M7I_7439 [Glarea lozoyensis 74030]
MKFQTASLTGEKVDGVASIFINEADDEVEEFVDLVVDGVLRATSTPKKGRGKKYTNTVSFDRVLYHRFEGGKKRGLKAGVMEVQLQNSLDDKEAADGQKTLDLGTVELQIWRKYPDALLPKDVVAAWNNVAQNSGESRAGSLEDFPRWSDQNLRLTTGVPQDFEIGLDFRLFTSVKFHLATPATLRGLGFEDVPEYQSASKAPAVQSTIGSEETAKQGRKPLPGAPEKAHKGEKPEKGSKVKTTVKSSTQSPSLPPDLHVSSASAALSIKRPEKRKPSILAEGDEVSRKLSFPPADRDSDDINKRITAARFRLEAAEKKKAKLDEQDRLAHEVQEMEQAAERLERENEIREATWGRSTED